MSRSARTVLFGMLGMAVAMVIVTVLPQGRLGSTPATQFFYGFGIGASCTIIAIILSYIPRRWR